jgi:hypothetical protein
MNPFTTDHPLTTQLSWFDAHPRWAWVGRILMLTLGMTPLVWYGLYRFITNDEDGMTTPGSNPLPITMAIAVLVAIAFAFSLVGSIILLLACAVWRRAHLSLFVTHAPALISTRLQPGGAGGDGLGTVSTVFPPTESQAVETAGRHRPSKHRAEARC